MLTVSASNKNFNVSIRMEEEAIAPPQLSKPPTIPLSKTIVKQGIVSILGTEKSTATPIRKTFSADMSSKQWLAQNGFFSPMKKTASSKDLAVEEDNEFKGPKMCDVWSTILSQKKDDDDTSSNLQTPYIHPLVKRSTSSLSEKSLEICTENLGSETGSDHGFSSSYTPSEVGDVDEEEKDEQQRQEYCSQSFEELQVVKYSKRSSSFPKSFPPPIHSLAKGGDNKPSLHMQSRRVNGRLILEAVSIPPQNLFHAQRHDGRLLLTFVNDTTPTSSSEPEMADHDEDFEEVFDDIDEGEDNQTFQFDYKSDYRSEEEQERIENGIKEGTQIMMQQKPRLSSGVIKLETSALMMKPLDFPVKITGKPTQFSMETKFCEFSPKLESHLGLGNRNLGTWSNKFNKAVNLIGSKGSTELMVELSKVTSVPQSLQTQLIPSPPAATGAASVSLNAYEYFWRKKPTVASIVNTPTIVKQCSKSPPGLKNNCTTNQVVSTSLNATTETNRAAYEQQDLVLMRGNKANMNYLVTFQQSGCKEARRSLLIWEPYCIATS